MTNESLRVAFRRTMREQVLLATHALTIEKGWERVRISDVAALVGVSRPTVYKEFGSKEGLGDAMVLKEAERFLKGIHAVLDDNAGDAADAFMAAVQFTLDEAERSPLLKAVLTTNGSDTPASQPHETGVLPLVATSATMLHTASSTVVGWFDKHFPSLDHTDVEDAVDALIRLTVSHLLVPTGGSAITGRRICLVALRYLSLDESRLTDR